MRKFILAAALAAVALPTALSAAPKPDADPAIWIVRDADTIVYLFGTSHLLNGKQDWFNDEVKTAFDDSSELVIEAIMPDEAAIQAKIGQIAVYTDGSTLSQRLSPELNKKLSSHLAAAGAPATAFDPLEPWFAAMALVGIATQKLGLKAEHAPEAILQAAAKERKLPVTELESFDGQLAMFDRMPEPQQIKFLASGIADIEHMESGLQELNATWARGDIEAFGAMLKQSLVDYPEIDKLIFADRNARWAEWIRDRMEKPGTVFMAVGAGHLAGESSVQALLEKEGLKATRVAG
jgi:uncharacterized protein YbaP (TraB family)